MASFSELNLNASLLRSLKDLGYTTPTTIQEKAFPVVMSGRDVLGIAQTGTGKTFAYLLPCLRLWKFEKVKYPQVLIVVPTRELVIQIEEEVKKLTTYMNVTTVGVYGGVNIRTQLDTVNEGLDVLVATPGRLMDLALSGTLKLKNVRRLVLDEVDEMLNLGFRTQITMVLDLLPVKRQNLMFSATITEEVESMIEKFFNGPVRIEAAPVGTPLEGILQSAYKVPNFYTKVNLLEHLLDSDKTMTKVLIFVDSKSLADRLHEQLEKSLGEQVGVIHSNKAQNARFAAVREFQSNKLKVLIATDLVSRGIDISEVTHVINFDTPEVAENYIHRIGRTGRADKKGIAITFITENEKEFKQNIEALMNYKIPMKKMPADVAVSDVLIDDELPKVQMPNVRVKLPKRENVGASFHAKSAKNSKVNIKVTRKESMKKKYGKAKTSRGKKK